MAKSRMAPAVIPEGQPFNGSIGIIATYCLVDNISASWLLMNDVGLFVAPQTSRLLPLTGTDVPSVSWVTPQGITPPTPGTGAAYILFFETGAPASPLDLSPVGGSTGVQGFVNPMTTTGDMIAYLATNPARLPIGTAGQVLTVSGGLPTWQPGPVGVTWPLTNTFDEAFQPNSVANNTLNLHNPASAVNGVQITGASTGNQPVIAAVGSDSTIPLSVSAKGNSQVSITGQTTTWGFGTSFVFGGGNGGSLTYSGGGAVTINAGTGPIATGIAFGISNGGGISSTNYINVQPAASGSPAIIGCAGVDAAIGIALTPKGTGIVDFHYAAVALGGGAAATLGTIGGAGPATAAQNSWLAVNVNGTASWIPIWR